MGIEFWTSSVGAARKAAGAAALLEQSGWTGMATVDSQNLASDPYVYLGLASTGSERLGLMTSVTNPVTRHPAATASAALTLQHLSGGRFVLGIGRGDSALAHLGQAPARLHWFEQYLRHVATYVSGGDVPFDETAVSFEVAPPIDELGLADRPTSSSIQWAERVARVPIEVAATGERVIGIAARHADRIMFALGAEPARVAWGIEVARRAAEAAGRDLNTLAFGAYVNVVCHDDVARAREIGLGSTSLFARFSVMHGTVSGPASESQHEVFANVHDKYDMNHHARSTGDQTTVLTDEFLDDFAVLGNAQHCADRLGRLVELGVDKFVIAGAQFDSRNPEIADAAQRVITDVAPALR